ncbi:MAG: ABC transporter permease [Deltaproteobacteria bacterium]|nr:MAG: ABC transporter permease [Deltaproteobacteria bacterium]
MLLLKLAWRSLWRNRRRTIITVVAISLALALAIFFIAFGEGVYAKMIDDAVRMQAGHVTVEHPDYRAAPSVDLTVDASPELRKRIERLPGVESTKALIVGQGVARAGQGVSGIVVLGVEPEVERRTSPLARKLVAGNYLEGSDGARVVLGLELARRLGLGSRKKAEKLVGQWWPWLGTLGRDRQEWIDELRPYLSIGRKLVIATNNARGELVEELVRVQGVFATGAPEIDGYIVQVPIGFARRLYGLGEGKANQLGVVLRSTDGLERVRREVQEVVGSSAKVWTWKQVLPDLAAYIEVDGGSNMIFQGIFFVLVLFVIFNTILMSVLERRREWAVLMAIGTTPGRLKGQIALESAILGLLGCLFGEAIGGWLAWWMERDGLDLRAFYPQGFNVSGIAIEPIVYADLTWQLMVVCGAIVFLSTMLVSLYPMGQLRRLRLADILRG